MENMKRLIAFGLDPDYVDYNIHKTLTKEIIVQQIDLATQKLTQLGYDIQSVYVKPNDAEQIVKENLEKYKYDCVLLGAGLRGGNPVLFENIINHFHKLQPEAKLCFNASPYDTVETFER